MVPAAGISDRAGVVGWWTCRYKIRPQKLESSSEREDLIQPLHAATFGGWRLTRANPAINESIVM